MEQFHCTETNSDFSIKNSKNNTCSQLLIEIFFKEPQERFCGSWKHLFDMLATQKPKDFSNRNTFWGTKGVFTLLGWISYSGFEPHHKKHPTLSFLKANQMKHGFIMYMWTCDEILYLLATHEQLIKCVQESNIDRNTLCHTQMRICCREMPFIQASLYLTLMDNFVIIMQKK